MKASRQLSILCVVGARPNFMKIAPIMRALKAQGIDTALVHTGQHYDTGMNERFFEDLRIPHPDISLEVGPPPTPSRRPRSCAALSRYWKMWRPIRSWWWVT